MATYNPPPHPLIYFTRLNPGNHRVTSPASRQYNCVAWAANIDHQCLWPSGAPGLMDEPEVIWPPGIRNDESAAALIDYFATLGYESCATPDYEPGYLKIAIFESDGEPTHVSRQLPSHKWTSKLGFDGVDIEHDDLECISGRIYGAATRFMKRPAASPPAAADGAGGCGGG